jgi:hypothetical protein
MNKTFIGGLFVLVGLAYGSTAFDFISSRTIGLLIQNDFIKQPSEKKVKKQLPLGPKPTIIFISLILIIIGIYILWS